MRVKIRVILGPYENIGSDFELVDGFPINSGFLCILFLSSQVFLITGKVTLDILLFHIALPLREATL